LVARLYTRRGGEDFYIRGGEAGVLVKVKSEE